MNGVPRAALLPAIAVLLVSGVLAIQLAYGGGDYQPLRPADPCASRTVTSRSDGIEGLTERLVLIALDDAACSLGVSREALTLQLAEDRNPTPAQVHAVREGLVAAVADMKADGSLPPASALVDEAVDSSDINGFLKPLIRAIPDSVIDAALKTDDVLVRVIDNLDLRRLLTDIDDPDALNGQIESAVTDAVRDALADRVRDLL